MKAPHSYKKTMTQIINKKKQSFSEKNNIGGHSLGGVDLDPNKDLLLSAEGEKGQEAYYKGKKMDYMDYYSELDDRIQKKKRGKSITNLGVFAGVNFDKNGKIIK